MDGLQSSSGDWTGNLFDFFFRVYGKLVKDVKIPFKVEGAFRVDDTPVHRAIREAFANCLVNTDFYLPRGVGIKKDANTIVFENPGCIRTGRDQMLKGGIADPRNKALMKMLNLIGIGERAGSGVPDIYGIWEQQGWKAPEVEEHYGPDRTILTLSFLKKVAIKSGDKKVVIKSTDKVAKPGKTKIQLETILQYMETDKEYRTSEIADVLQVKVSRTRKLLAVLAEEGKIEALGGNRDRHYMKKQC